jgi:hypothetical protein
MATTKKAKTAITKKSASPKPAPPAKPAFRKVGQALEALRAGDTSIAPAAFHAFEEQGEGQASVALAVLAAYSGRWDEAIVHAGRAFAKPGSIYAGNVWWDDMQTLLIRAARVTGSFDAALKAVPTKAPFANGTDIYKTVREKLSAAKKGASTSDPADPPDPAGYAKYVAEQEADKKWAKWSAGERVRKRFYLAANCGMWDEAIGAWKSRPKALHFNHSVRLAPVLHARGESDRAWEVLASTLYSWTEVDGAQITPYQLLEDDLWPIMSPERLAHVLASPRGATCWNAMFKAGKVDW